MTTYTENCSRNIAGNSAGAFDNLVQKSCYYLKRQLLKVQIHQERRQLLSMSEAMLKDIGISQADAKQEARRTDLPVARLKNL